MEKESILEEAQRLTTQDRRNSYGHPLDDYTRTAGMFNANFRAKIKEDFTAEDMILVMEMVKISRETNCPKRDNRTDGAGYWNCLDMVHQERERRKPK